MYMFLLRIRPPLLCLSQLYRCYSQISVLDQSQRHVILNMDTWHFRNLQTLERRVHICPTLDYWSDSCQRGSHTFSWTGCGCCTWYRRYPRPTNREPRATAEYPSLQLYLIQNKEVTILSYTVQRDNILYVS